jgi:YVTN family beta-propeller protein
MTGGTTGGTRGGLHARRLAVTFAALAGGLFLAAPQAASARTGYVVNTASATIAPSITPFNTTTGLPGGPIALPAKSEPGPAAITPDGRTLYVVNEGEGANSVTPMNTATNTVGTAIPVGSAPRGLAIAPDGKTAYVVTKAGKVIPINLATNTPGTAIEVGGTPETIAITPDGHTAYVVSAGTTTGTVTPINLATNAKGAPIAVGNEADGIAITPDGKTAYVADGKPTNTVIPINLATNTAGTPIKVGERPRLVAITPDGKTVYVTNNDSETVTPINTATNLPGSPIAGGKCPGALAISPNGRTVYVLDACKKLVTPIDTATNKPGTTIAVGEFPDGIAIMPNQPPLAAFAASAVTVGQATSFTAAASSDSDDAIAAYAWEFGDGVTASTATPATSHTYAAPGTYTARLTLTDSEGCSTSFVFTGQTAFCSGAGSATATHLITVAALPPAPPHSSAPTLTAVTETHATWRSGHRLATLARTRRPPLGTTFAFTLNAPANVTLAFSAKLSGRRVKHRCLPQKAGNRHKPRCSRMLAQGALTFAAHAGLNKVSFQGRMSRARTLGAGHYTVLIAATNAAGQHSAPAPLSFTIVR